MRRLAGFLALLATLAPHDVRGVQLEALEPGQDWQLRALRFEGNKALGRRALEKVMLTKPRRWFAIWRQRPPFDPITFRTDLERLRRLYQSHGYYHATVAHDIELPAEGRAVDAVVYVEEGPPVQVERVDITLAGAELPAVEEGLLRDHLPLVSGKVFTEEAYEAGFTYLRAYYREHGFARVKVSKRAGVDVARDTAIVLYQVESGPASVFGETEIEGNRAVEEDVVHRELAFEPDEPFKQSLLDQTRKNLTGLNLFRSVRIDEDEGDDPRVDLRVHVDEAPPREVRLGIGYDTEEQLRGLASWRHYNFFGGARQLGFTARASFIQRTLAADFLQPHFPGHANRTRLLFALTQDDEDTYTLDRTRLSPRLEWQATPRVTGFAFHRTDYDQLSEVSDAVRAALPDAVQDGLLSGFGFGADWNRTDDLLDPTKGFATSAMVEPVGGGLGGDFDFVRVIGDARVYQPIVGRLIGAARLRLGAAEPFNDTSEIPLFERFYAGGINSVRGYGRRRVGPLVDDEPVGGRTLVEVSGELRHPITEEIGGAVFLDAGQVGGVEVAGSTGCGGERTGSGQRKSVSSFEFRIDEMCYGTGAGVRYKSPIGLLRLDLGFPIDPAPGDDRWQIHFSLGATF